MSEERPEYAAALTTQVGGNHYKDMPIQPVEYIHKNGIGYFEGCVIKYVSRWRKKNGVEDLKKARHFLDLLIEFEDAQQAAHIETGAPGECELCGEWSGRLVRGACAPCRDRYKLP